MSAEPAPEIDRGRRRPRSTIIDATPRWDTEHLPPRRPGTPRHEAPGNPRRYVPYSARRTWGGGLAFAGVLVLLTTVLTLALQRPLGFVALLVPVIGLPASFASVLVYGVPFRVLARAYLVVLLALVGCIAVAVIAVPPDVMYILGIWRLNPVLLPGLALGTGLGFCLRVLASKRHVTHEP